MKTEQSLNSHYDNLGYYSPLDVWTLDQIAGQLQAEIEPPILDLGCGDGRLARRNPHLEVVGVDYNEKRAAAAGAVCADLYAWLRENEREFGLVTMIEVLEHLERPRDAIRLARQAGPLLATVPIDMEYVAHLQYWEKLSHLIDHLEPERHAQLGQHAVLWWDKT